MESLPLFVNQGRAAVFGKQPYPYHWVAAEDIARMVSTAYELGKAANKRCIVHGPEAIGMPEALRRYCSVFHPDIKAVSSMPFWLVRLLATFTRSQELKVVGEMMSYFEKVGEGAQTEVDSMLARQRSLWIGGWSAERHAARQGLNDSTYPIKQAKKG